MGKINILITSAGRRVSLVKNFQKHAKVYTCDANPHLSSACQVSDGFFKVPKVTESTYKKYLFEICKEKNIKIIIPTIDTELIFLASFKRDFLKKGIFIAVSDENLCKTFSLKTSSENFFLKNNFKTPKIISDLENSKYPLFAKLDNSSSSIGACKVNDYEDALCFIRRNKNYVFQEYIKGIEYTVDVFIDSSGKVISIVPRERIEVRGGEVSKGRTVKNREIIDEIKKFCNILKGAYGTITVQVFKTNKGIYFIEVNPRFGGGYPLSYLAGADFAKYLINDYLGIELEYNEDWQDNLIMLRYDAEVLIDANSL
jgi:carbamoyl-phosphate synthase large subunit